MDSLRARVRLNRGLTRGESNENEVWKLCVSWGREESLHKRELQRRDYGEDRERDPGHSWEIHEGKRNGKTSGEGKERNRGKKGRGLGGGPLGKETGLKDLYWVVGRKRETTT